MSEYVVCETNLGWMGAVLRRGRVSATILPRPRRDQAEEALRLLGGSAPAADGGALEVAARLRRCTEGADEPFSTSELDMEAGTPFQQAVWRALLEIPRGETRSYAWVAERVGRPRAVRAVGQAVGHNPLPIIVPCHRVIGSDGSLHGFGGGLPMKAALLGAEDAAPRPLPARR